MSVSIMSCTSSLYKDLNKLSCSGEYLNFSLDNNTTVPKYGVFLFEDHTGRQYLTFQNRRNEILIYDVLSGQIFKRMSLGIEGNNAIKGGFAGYYICDFNNILVSSLGISTLFVVDSTSSIRKTIDFSVTDNKEMLMPLVLLPGRPITVVEDKFYIPQKVNPMLGEKIMDDSRIGAVIDTIRKTIQILPMKFPSLITYKDIGTSAGFGADYAYCYNGKDFIYSFFYSNIMYRANSAYDKIDQIEVKSRYVNNVSVVRLNSSDLRKVVKITCESPSYGDIVYDKYRDVYYRFVYPKTELSSSDDPFDINMSGRKVFSIMVLDKDLNILGETMFPEYTYNSKLYFVLEDGLYLSTNHIKNPQYSDDLLTFERINLVLDDVKP